MTRKARKLVSFDWAMKHLLRQKENFDVLEGFLSELLKEDISIESILESESNQENEFDKYNRVDLKVKDTNDNRFVIEVQYNSQSDYPHRMLWGVSRAISEMLNKGDNYDNIKKVISINIVYYDFGKGLDFIYHGINTFKGMYQHDELQLSTVQQKKYLVTTMTELYPEYYIIKVNGFNDKIKDALTEWIYFMKHEEVKGEFQAKGLSEAKEKLDSLKLSPENRIAYKRYIEDRRVTRSTLQTAKEEGWQQGMQQGVQQGVQQGMQQNQIETANRMLVKGIDIETIAELTQLSIEQINQLKTEN